MSVQRTKYGSISHSRDEPDTQPEPEPDEIGNEPVTYHASVRWDERTPWDSVSPEYALENGVDVSELRDHFEDADGSVAHRVVYWHNDDYGVCLLVQNGVVVTVYKEEYLNLKARLMLLGVRRLIEDE